MEEEGVSKEGREGRKKIGVGKKSVRTKRERERRGKEISSNLTTNSYKMGFKERKSRMNFRR